MEYNNWSGSNRTSNLKSSTCMWCSQGTAHKMHTCMCTWKRWKSLIISQLISCNNYLLNLQWSLFNADKSVKLIKCFFKCLYEAMCQLSSEREEWNWANLPHLAPPCTPPPPNWYFSLTWNPLTPSLLNACLTGYIRLISPVKPGWPALQSYWLMLCFLIKSPPFFKPLVWNRLARIAGAWK